MVKTESQISVQPNKKINWFSLIYGIIWIFTYGTTAFISYPGFPAGVVFGIIVALLGSIVMVSHLYVEE
jgi:hypothetical protein